MDPDRVRLYLRLRTTSSPLFQFEKLLKAAVNEIPDDRFEDWIAASEGYSSAVAKVNELAFTSSFGEYNPGGGTRSPKYLELARGEVINCRDALKTIDELLQARRRPPPPAAAAPRRRRAAAPRRAPRARARGRRAPRFSSCSPRGYSSGGDLPLKPRRPERLTRPGGVLPSPAVGRLHYNHPRRRARDAASAVLTALRWCAPRARPRLLSDRRALPNGF